MSYRDRVQDYISLLSPQGNVFWAKFIGGDITGKKRVGQFNYPGIDGTVVQDQGMEGWLWPLTLIFDEDPGLGNTDHDLVAMQFQQALAERGSDGWARWEVRHPVYGLHYLQPLEFVLKSQPVASDGAIELETQWIEPITQKPQVSTPEAAGATLSQVNTTSATAAAQIGANTAQTSADLISAVRSGYTSAVASIKGYLNTADQTTSAILAAISATSSGVVDVLGLAGQVAALMTTPSLLIGDAASKIQTFARMGAAVLASGPTAASAATQATKNTAAVVELFATGVLSGMCQTAALGGFTTRPQVVQAINDVTGYLSTMTNALDGIQSAFTGTALAGQYFSQGRSFADALRLVNLTVAYLLSVLFSLSVVKTYTLTNDTPTVAEAIRQYTSKGAWQDSYFDLFCQQNGIYGTEILLLKRGRRLQVFL